MPGLSTSPPASPPFQALSTPLSSASPQPFPSQGGRRNAVAPDGELDKHEDIALLMPRHKCFGLYGPKTQSLRYFPIVTLPKPDFFLWLTDRA